MVARSQDEHRRINAQEYPGTRQLCSQCEAPTDRCEEDAIYTAEGCGPLCESCWRNTPEWQEMNEAETSHDAKGCGWRFSE
jgi:hypothetical protein